MRKLFAYVSLILFSVGFAISLNSCEKCHECTVVEKDTTVIYYYERHCETGSGSSDKIEEWEAELRSKYNGYYIYCNIVN